MPEMREVRQNARTVIHRTYDGVIAGTITTACGDEIVHKARDPRVWQGHSAREFTECPVCFAPEAPDPNRPILPGDLVTLTAAHGLPSNPRGWTPEQVYVYVGPTRHYANRAVVLVENGWRVADNLDRMPVGSEAAELATARMEAWSVQADGMEHAPADTDPDDFPPRIRRARNRLIALRPAVPDSPSLEHPVRLCEQGDSSGHPNTAHTHTTQTNPLWGDPATPNVAGREMWPDGSYVLYVKGTHAHLVTPTTTERETQPVPPEQPYPVGTDIYPITNQHIRALGPGSVVTVLSGSRGVEHGDRIQFGCKDFPHRSLREAQATVRYTPRGIICEADITLDGTVDYLTMAGQRISLAELRDYATSVVVKEIVDRPAENALVMEHGFYGCAVHPGEVIFVGNGHPRGREVTGPLVGKVYGATDDNNRMTGTVGQGAGLRQSTFLQCTPVLGATTASTMHMTRRRAWALVPATPDQITRVMALRTGARFAVATTTSEQIVACNMDGVPSEAPVAAEAVPVF